MGTSLTPAKQTPLSHSPQSPNLGAWPRLRRYSVAMTIYHPNKQGPDTLGSVGHRRRGTGAGATFAGSARCARCASYEELEEWPVGLRLVVEYCPTVKVRVERVVYG